MADDPLLRLCLNAATGTADDQDQRSAAPAEAELAAIALGYVRVGCAQKGCDSRCAGGKTPAADCLLRVRRIVQNYPRLIGTVTAMLTPGSLAGEAAWEEWRAYILRLAQRKGFTGDDAQDLTQETYLQLRKALRDFRFESQLQTFCWHVFGNCYLQWQKHHGLIAIHEMPLTLPEDEEGDAVEREPVDPSPALEAQVADHEARDEIEAELARVLNSTDLLILRWYYLDKGPVECGRVSDRVIGEYLGMPLNTVTGRRRAALVRLQQSPALRALRDQMSFLDRLEAGA